MGKVTVGGTMSLDGFVAGVDDTGFDRLFRWYGNGEVELRMGDMTNRVTPQSAEHLRNLLDRTGALVVGRHLYDLTHGWGGRHPMDVTTVVLTHNPPADLPDERDFVFVTEGIEAAVAKAQEIAGGKDVGLNSGQIARQALEAGLIDEVGIDLAPVFLGAGTPFFADLGIAPVDLVGPVSVVQGKEVLHLTYLVPDRP